MPYALNYIGAVLSSNDVRTAAQGPAHKVGTCVTGSDGRQYVYYKSDASGIADGTRISIAHATGVATEAATGAFDTVGATAADGYGWAVRVENYAAAAGTETVI